MEQGVQFGKYTVIPRVLIFVFRGRRVLLLKGAPTKKIWPGLFNGVGGHVEPNETPLQCAERELFEETGLSGIPLKICGIVHIDITTQPGIVLFVYKGEYTGGKLIPSEEGELHWIDPVEIHILPLVPDLIDLIPRIDAWKPADGVIYGQYYYKNGKMVTDFT